MLSFDQLILKRYPLWTLYLSHYQSYLGRCFIVLNRDGNLDPFFECSDREWSELRAIISDDLGPALKRLFDWDMLNYDNLRNSWPHCHWHVVPRYKELRVFQGVEFVDKNWGVNWSRNDYDKEVSLTDDHLLALREAVHTELNHSSAQP